MIKKFLYIPLLAIFIILLLFITACTPIATTPSAVSEIPADSLPSSSAQNMSSMLSTESASSSLPQEISSRFSINELSGFTDDNSMMQLLVLDDDNLIVSYRVGNPADITLGFSHEIYRYNISEKTITKLYTERFEEDEYSPIVDNYYSPIVEYYGVMNNEMRLTKALDGKYALCFSGHYYIFSGDTLVKTGSVNVPGKIVVTMVMSPDLSCYAYRAKNFKTISGYGKYYIADTETGEKRFDDYFWAYDVVFSPDGKKISFKRYDEDNTYLGLIDPVTGYWNDFKLNADQEYDYSFFGFTWSGNNTLRYFNKITQSDENRITTNFGVEINRVNLSDSLISTDYKFNPDEDFYNAEINYEVFDGDLYITRTPIEANRHIELYRVTQSGAELIFKYPCGKQYQYNYSAVQALPNGGYVMLCSVYDSVTDGTENQSYQIIIYK